MRLCGGGKAICGRRRCSEFGVIIRFVCEVFFFVIGRKEYNNQARSMVAFVTFIVIFGLNYPLGFGK